MLGSLKNLSGQEGAPAKAPSLIEVGTTRSEFGSLPNLQSQKNWQFALIRDGKDKTIRLKNGNRVFALRFDGDMTKDSYEKQQPVPLTRLSDLDEKDFLSGADVVSKGVFQVHRSTPNSIHGTLQDGKNNSSMIFEIGDDGKWMMRPKPKARLSQVAAKFVSSVGTGKQASMKCPECGKAPGKYRIHGDAIQCGSCEKTSDMEKWDKAAALFPPGSLGRLSDKFWDVSFPLLWSRKAINSLESAANPTFLEVIKAVRPTAKIVGSSMLAGGALSAYRRRQDPSVHEGSEEAQEAWDLYSKEQNAPAYEGSAEAQETWEIYDKNRKPRALVTTPAVKKEPLPVEAKPSPPAIEAKPSPPAIEAKPSPPAIEAKPSPPTAAPLVVAPPVKTERILPQANTGPDMSGFGKSVASVAAGAAAIGGLRYLFNKFRKNKTAATDDEIRKTLKVYAVDLDGTLAHNDGRDFDPNHIGKPVPGMMRLVRLWLRRGHEVRIFTARAADKKNIPRIKEWLKEHNLPDLEITNEKTPEVSAIYDDRCVQVEKNTGRLAKLSSLFALNKTAIVEQEGDEWLLYTRDKSRVLGRHKKPEDAYKQEYAIQKSQERSKMGSLFGHFKVAGIRLPNIPVIARAPAVIGETAGAISNGTFVDGFGKGVGALEKGVNTAAGLTGAADLANTALTTIKPLGSMLAVNAPLVSGGLSMVAEKIAPPVWAASMAMQTGQAIANPAQTAAESHKELSNTPLLGRVWAGASNPPKAILGGAKAMYDAGDAVVDYAKGEMKGTISALKNWYSTSGPGSLHHQPIKKSGGLIGKYLQVLRDRFCAARKNVNASPSEAQIKAQNYRMGHVWVQGLDITIESPKGSTRSGMDSKGNKWSVTMKNDYGYIRNHPRSEADGDHVDVFVGDHPDSEVVFVIDQFIDGKWDEHKVVVGAKTEKEARQTYLDNYAQKNWKGLRSITALTMRQFKKWLTDGDTSKPLAGQQYRDFLKTAEHDIQYPKIIGDIVHSDMVAKPAVAIGGGALRGMAVASIIHALRRAKRDAFDQSHRGLSLLKDLGTGAMIGAGTGLLAHAIPPAAEKLYDTFDVQPDSKLQKLSAHFMDVVLAPVNSTPGIGSVLGAGYGALAGAGKGIYRRTKGFLTGDPPEPDAIKNDIIDGMAQGANYGAYFGLTGPNPPRPDPKTKVVNTSEKLKKMRTVIPRR